MAELLVGYGTAPEPETKTKGVPPCFMFRYRDILLKNNFARGDEAFRRGFDEGFFYSG